MEYKSIEEIYNGNTKVRTRLKELLSSLSESQITTLPEGEKWTVAEIVEHIAMVDEGAMKICTRLLKKAQDAGQLSDGQVAMSKKFMERGAEIARMKVEAPAFVQPTSSKTISESLAKLDENASQLEQLRSMFESVDSTALKFPHPFFGDISAQEWLALKGGHEMRHIKQIEKVLSKI